jgi:hypothetical protein
MDNATTPPASNKKRKTKTFPSELANVTDDDRSRFGMALELDPNPKRKTFGSEFLVAQAVTVNVKGRDVPFQLKSMVVGHLRRQLCKNVGVVNCGSGSTMEGETTMMIARGLDVETMGLIVTREKGSHILYLIL